MKILKFIGVIILIILTFSIIGYLFLSVVKMDLNIYHWSENWRGGMAIYDLFIIAFSLLFIGTNYDELFNF